MLPIPTTYDFDYLILSACFERQMHLGQNILSMCHDFWHQDPRPRRLSAGRLHRHGTCTCDRPGNSRREPCKPRQPGRGGENGQLATTGAPRAACSKMFDVSLVILTKPTSSFAAVVEFHGGMRGCPCSAVACRGLAVWRAG